jgi:HSP20 family protein
MSLVRWEPFRELDTLHYAINRLFGDRYFQDGVNPGQNWMFPVDIKENDNSIVVHAEIPGMNKDDIKLSYDDNVLSIRGERKSDVREEKANYIKVERKYGFFSRSFSIDVPVDHEAIKASYKDGILEITLPKKDKAKARQIEIDVN